MDPLVVIPYSEKLVVVTVAVVLSLKINAPKMV
jgi:hypothetical protein